MTAEERQEIYRWGIARGIELAHAKVGALLQYNRSDAFEAERALMDVSADLRELSKEYPKP